jgi:hypothetical protein
MRPNLFIIGSAKAGTTSIAKYLSEHSQIFITTPKELHFFNDDFFGRRTETKEKYLQYFENAPKSALYWGEASPSYLVSSTAVKNIMAFNPKARFIVIVRNPTDVVISLHGQRVWEGQEPIANFQKAWESEAERKEGRLIPLHCKDHKRLIYSYYGQIGTHLFRLANCVPDNQIKVLNFDELRAQPRDVIADCLRFLDLPYQYVNFREIHNRRKNVKSVAFSRLISNGIKVKEAIGIKRHMGMAQWLREKNMSASSNADVTEDMRKELTNFFLDEVRLIEKFTGWNLDQWKR